jgi:hypothetical protein
LKRRGGQLAVKMTTDANRTYSGDPEAIEESTACKVELKGVEPSTS